MDARRSSTDRETTRSSTVVDPRTSLAIWLRTGRAEKGLSLEDVARITKIQLKTLERLEAGTSDGLPAEVFVRGFVRSYARCVGLDEDEALKRYQQCNNPTPVVVDPETIPVAARAVVEAMADLAPTVAEQISEPEASIDSQAEAAKPSKKRRRGAKRAKRRSARMATGTPFEPTPVVDAEAEAAAEAVADPAPVAEAAPEPAPIPDPEPTPVEAAVAASEVLEDEPPATETWQPTMPPLKTTPTTNVPWRLGRPASKPARPLVPSLVIDDAEPEIAERVLEERAARAEDGHDAPRRSFLPPILLDRDDRSIRQGGLTLAVILLLIAATLTLSYLMRRPSSSGDGVTQADSPASLTG